ncbi:hypothetical protein ACH4OX_33035 [Streptomyces roseolus]|uniref:hypothetical protein n=1 Tax=Streptomyces roseolus TaxID=67358 RepID=UPI0037A5E146
MRTSTERNSPAVTYNFGDYVLYRDPELFWTGKTNHTFVCRVGSRWTDGTYHLTALASGKVVPYVRPDYMRLLPPIDAMRDIDTAPLHGADAADGMTAAAMAWLTQQHTTANQRPELPEQR